MTTDMFYRRGPIAMQDWLAERSGSNSLAAHRVSSPLPPSMGNAGIDIRPQRHDTHWISLGALRVIAPLVDFQINRVGDAGHLINLTRVGPKIFVIHQTTEIALEGPEIRHIKANHGREQPHIGFGKDDHRRDSDCRPDGRQACPRY